MSNHALAEAYRRFWQGRSSAGAVRTDDQAIREISDDLDDLRTHPRLRKKRTEKLAEIEQRISASSLSAEQKALLMEAFRSAL
ncbi:hypothetical protein ACFFIY_10255 [Bhargavaea ullalensis]|uniref:Uncharacterized protein n=1 Tax=Bhargavaea ullalensis TaxID=1265685 RepID=A0ABV2G9E9_9BACL